MGRIQKLREQRKLEDQQKIEAKSQKNKKIVSGIVIGVAILGVVIYALSTIIKDNENKKISQSQTDQSPLPTVTATPPQIFPSINSANTTSTMPTANKIAVIETARGNIKLELYANDAPKTVANFISLIDKGFYNRLTFHRVIQGFIIQGGDPNGNGTGGPGYAFEDEINPWSLGLSEATIKSYQAEGYKYTRDVTSYKMVAGALAMANSGPNTNGSQFFIVTDSPQTHLDGKHTVFGSVIEGMDVVRKIQQGDIIKSIATVNQ